MLSKYNIIIISLSDKGCLTRGKSACVRGSGLDRPHLNFLGEENVMLDIVASLSAMVLSILLTASLWRQRRVGSVHSSLLGVMFTIVYIYSVAAHQDSVYRNHEAAAWAALIAYTTAAALAVAEYRVKITAWISRLRIRQAQAQKVSAIIKMAETQLSLPEQAWGPREGYSPESPDTDA